MYKKFIKRALDTFFGLVILIITSPLILLTAFILVISNKGFPFFIQSRPGLEAELFKVIKFKTMMDKRDKAGQLLPDAERLSSIGKFIRSTSIDELPQLVNVVKGDMSLIGPRPLLEKYLPLYNAYQARRHDVRPGITGWAQVNGRNAITWEQRFALDIYYVENLCFALDLKIVLLTIRKVWKREGISASGSATMQAFKGNRN